MKIHLAPMEGVLDPILRQTLLHVGGIDQATTEFIRITQTVLPSHVFLKKAPELLVDSKVKSTPVYVQLLGGNPEMLAENAKALLSLRPAGIDLNFGCPAPTVNRHDGGATLLKQPKRLFDVISAVRHAVNHQVPVTAKVRLGFDHKDFHAEIAAAVGEAKASALTVHARTRNEGYLPPAHWEYVARMQEHVSCPVYLNGEIWTVTDYINATRVTGIKDVALGRGLVSNPYLALEIRAHIQGMEFTRPSFSGFASDVLLPHLNASMQVSETYAVQRLKQWLRYLSRTYAEAKWLFDQVKTASKMADALRYIP